MFLSSSSAGDPTIILTDNDDSGNGRGNDDDDNDSSDSDDDGQSIVAADKDSDQVLVAAASICGNGVLEGREECDDSNRRDEDGCNSTCLLEIGICGDGIVQSLLGEQCEQSTHDASLTYGCARCLYLSIYCGDGTIDAGEECDDGPRNSTSPDAKCRPDCHVSSCGDAIVDSAETCDDGNRLNGDGCSRFCTKETSTVVAAQQGNEASIEFPADVQAQLQHDILGQQFQYPAFPPQYQFPFPMQQQQMQMHMPIAQLQPLIQSRGPVGETGPAAVAVAASGVAAGFGWVRRRKRTMSD